MSNENSDYLFEGTNNSTFPQIRTCECSGRTVKKICLRGSYVVISFEDGTFTVFEAQDCEYGDSSEITGRMIHISDLMDNRDLLTGAGVLEPGRCEELYKLFSDMCNRKRDAALVAKDKIDYERLKKKFEK